MKEVKPTPMLVVRFSLTQNGYAHVNADVRRFNAEDEKDVWSYLGWHESKIRAFAMSAQGSFLSGGQKQWYAHRVGAHGEYSDLTEMDAILDLAPALARAKRKMDETEREPGIPGWLISWAWAMGVKRFAVKNIDGGLTHYNSAKADELLRLMADLTAQSTEVLKNARA